MVGVLVRMGKDVWERMRGCCPPSSNAGAQVRHTVASVPAMEGLQGWAQEVAESQHAPTSAAVSCPPAKSQTPPCTLLLFSLTILLLCLHITAVTRASHAWKGGRLGKPVHVQGPKSRHSKNGCQPPGSGRKALMHRTAKCRMSSNSGVDVSCCLASCSPITKGNNLSTSGLPQELK